LMTMFWLRLSLPTLPAHTRTHAGPRPSRNILALFISQPMVTLGMLASGLYFMGQFTLYTYVRPFLETVTLLESSALSLMLLVIGASGVIGNALIGRVLQRSLYGTLICASVLMSVLALALLIFGHVVPATVILFSLWGLISISVPVGWWSWLAKTLPDNAETGGALLVAVVQLSIGFGSIVGGVLWDGFSGPAGTFALSGALLLVSAVLTLLTSRQQHRTQSM